MIRSQLCWNCKNAVPSASTGCSWSRSFVPVDGWDAEETVLYQVANGRSTEVRSFHIMYCPEFEDDRRENENEVNCGRCVSFTQGEKHKEVGYCQYWNYQVLRKDSCCVGDKDGEL